MGRGLRPRPFFRCTDEALARDANEQTKYKNPHYLDTLALALHRTGDTLNGVVYQRKAVELAPQSVRGNYEDALATFEAAIGDRRKQPRSDSPSP